MKRILAVAVLAMVSAGAVQAQNPEPRAPGQAGSQAPGQRGAGRRMAALMAGISLSTEQQARVDSIVARYQAQMPAMTPGSPPDSATRATRMTIQTQQDADIRAVLTADQQVIFDRNIEAARQNMGRPRP